jgi:hypothetical protein
MKIGRWQKHGWLKNMKISKWDQPNAQSVGSSSDADSDSKPTHNVIVMAWLETLGRHHAGLELISEGKQARGNSTPSKLFVQKLHRGRRHCPRAASNRRASSAFHQTRPVPSKSAQSAKDVIP